MFPDLEILSVISYIAMAGKTKYMGEVQTDLAFAYSF
jgi:hypothetical protein